jgi:hypothetical protein
MYVQGPRLLPVWNFMFAIFQDPNLGMSDVSFLCASLYLIAGGANTRAATVINPVLVETPYLT